MPLYSATATMTALYPGDSFTLSTAETVTSGQFSAAFNIASSPLQNAPYSISIEGIFSADPGTFSFQVQESNTNASANFVNIGTAISTVNAGFTFHADFTGQAGRFYRLSYTTQTSNSVTFSANAYRP
jgi:hypothetical protein